MRTVDYDRLGLRPGERVLDVGCGAGRHAFEAYRRGAGQVVAVDLDREALVTTDWMLRAMHGNGEGAGATVSLQGDIRRLPLPADSVDRVICSETLEHVHEDGVAMDELVRVLRPGGRLVVTVPRYWPERVCWALSEEYHNVAGGHVRIYRASALQQALTDLGLTYRERHHAHALHSPYWWLQCALGTVEEGARIPRLYQRMLEWDMMHPRSPLPWIERALDPLAGKSVVLYFEKPGAERTARAGSLNAPAGSPGAPAGSPGGASG